jgi:hypothetical protein
VVNSHAHVLDGLATECSKVLEWLELSSIDNTLCPLMLLFLSSVTRMVSLQQGGLQTKRGECIVWSYALLSSCLSGRGGFV